MKRLPAGRRRHRPSSRAAGLLPAAPRLGPRRRYCSLSQQGVGPRGGREPPREPLSDSVCSCLWMPVARDGFRRHSLVSYRPLARLARLENAQSSSKFAEQLIDRATAPANVGAARSAPGRTPAGPRRQPVANRRGGGGDSAWRTIALQGGGSYGASPTGWRRYARRGPPGVPREGVSTRIDAAAAKIRCGEQ